jgi:Na+/H+-dicarboxylate symporter
MADTPSNATDVAAPAARRGLPLYARVLIGVAFGTLLGAVFGSEPILFGLRNDHLGQLGVLVIKLLKALAVPLIFLSIVDAFVRTEFSARQGGKLLFICLFNVSVAMGIGLVIMNLFQPGQRWAGDLGRLVSLVPGGGADQILRESKKATLSPLDNLAGYVPKSMLDPFTENNVIAVVLCALLAGAAFRRIKNTSPPDAEDVRSVERFVEGAFRTVVQMLHWIVALVPLAVFGVVAQVVGRAGIGVFSVLWIFLATILAGMAIHALVYYPLVVWVVGRLSPRRFLGTGADAIVTGLSCNSSLATVPITLSCLAKLGVSNRSARLAACVGTNLNNDGITLYEAMTALFLAQAVGFELGFSQQFTIVIQSVVAGAGVAGIPEAGLIVLPLVLSAAGIPDAVVAGALPLILTVDWIIARCRSAVNVMSDMVVAILLDVGQRAGVGAEAVATVETSAEAFSERRDDRSA